MEQIVFKEDNKVRTQDRAIHECYRFVLSFPPHLVGDYLHKFRVNTYSTVLDPFCGTGTTLVECKKLGIPSVGVESNPLAFFASQVKVDWSVDCDGLREHANRIAKETMESLERQPSVLRKLPTETESLLLTHSISPVPLHKVLVLLETIEAHPDQAFNPFEKLALAKALVSRFSNLRFGPEVGLGPVKQDAPVVPLWIERVRSMADDLRTVRSKASTPSKVLQGDSREISRLVAPNSIDAVITSPPYPNEKDYTRTTRLESVLLGFVRNKVELRCVKQAMIRSNTRGVYKADTDDRAIASNVEIQELATQIERRRLELGKTS